MAKKKYTKIHLEGVVIYRYEDKDVWKTPWTGQEYYVLFVVGVLLSLVPIFYVALINYIGWDNYVKSAQGLYFIISFIVVLSIVILLIQKVGEAWCHYVIEDGYLKIYRYGSRQKSVKISLIRGVKLSLNTDKEHMDILPRLTIEQYDKNEKINKEIHIYDSIMSTGAVFWLKCALVKPTLLNERLEQLEEDIILVMVAPDAYEDDDQLEGLMAFSNYPTSWFERTGYLSNNKVVYSDDLKIMEVDNDDFDNMVYEVEKKNIISSSVVNTSKGVYKIVLVNEVGVVHYLSLVFESKTDATQIMNRMLEQQDWAAHRAQRKAFSLRIEQEIIEQEIM